MSKIFINEGINIYLKAKFPLVLFYIILINGLMAISIIQNLVGLDTVAISIIMIFFTIITSAYLELKYEAKAVNKLNEKYNFTQINIKKRIVVKAIINMAIITIIMSLLMIIPVLGIIIGAVYTLCDPIFTEQFYINVFKTNKMSFSFANILPAIKQHLKFMVIMFFVMIVITIAGFGILGVVFIMAGITSSFLLLVALNILVIGAVLISIYQNAIIMSYFVKNPTVNEEAKILKNSEF